MQDSVNEQVGGSESSSNSNSKIPARLYLRTPNAAQQFEGCYILMPEEFRDDLPVWRVEAWGLQQCGAIIYSHCGRWRCASASGLSGRPKAWSICAAHDHNGLSPASYQGGWVHRTGRDDQVVADEAISVTELEFEDSYAQFGQDIYAMGKSLFAGRRGGFFVEIGAGDGVEGSTTCLMEKKFDWSGICIEGREEPLATLKTNRPKSCCTSAVLWASSGIAMDFVTAGMLSGLADTLDHQSRSLRKKPRNPIVTKTLTDVLVEFNAPDWIDYMSVDTEGSELEILKGIDWERYTFGYLTVEHNFVYPRREHIRAFLAERGYALARECFPDDEFVHARFAG